MASGSPLPYPHALAAVPFRQRDPAQIRGAQGPCSAGLKGRNNPEKFQGCRGQGSPPHSPVVTGPEEAAVTSPALQAAQALVPCGRGPGQRGGGPWAIHSILFHISFPLFLPGAWPLYPVLGNMVFNRETILVLKLV